MKNLSAVLLRCGYKINQKNIFYGTCENPTTKSGKPLQYEFEAEGKPQVLLDYKKARMAMGAMIDRYK